MILWSLECGMIVDCGLWSGCGVAVEWIDDCVERGVVVDFGGGLTEVSIQESC